MMPLMICDLIFFPPPCQSLLALGDKNGTVMLFFLDNGYLSQNLIYFYRMHEKFIIMIIGIMVRSIIVLLSILTRGIEGFTKVLITILGRTSKMC
jgi:hypothetical protein